MLFAASVLMLAGACESRKPDPAAPEQEFVLIILGASSAKVGETQCALDEIASCVEAETSVAEPAEAKLMIRTEEAVPAHTFTEVLTRLREAGFERIVMIAEDL